MSFLFTQSAGQSLPEHVITVDEWVFRLDNGLLTPLTISFGFKTYVDKPLLSPKLLDEKKYIKAFRENWDSAVEESAKKYNITPKDFRKVITPKRGTSKIDNDANTNTGTVTVTDCNVTLSIEQALRQSAKEGTYVAVNTMASNRPALQLNGLPTVSEDCAATTTSTKPTDRKAAKLNMLKRMRPPPFTNVWAFWHDKYVAPTVTDASPSTTYENRLTLMSAEIHDIKEFYQIYNNTPCENLRQRDSFHLFKRGVKPVWEDPRNVHGGCWTFRVPKEKSTEFWMMLQVIAIGEGFDDVIEPTDDICGLSLTTRFTSNLIMLWNRNGTNQKSIDGILEVVLEELPDHLKPKDSSYYYKKHSEHAGFSEVVAAAKGKKEVEQEEKKKSAKLAEWKDFAENEKEGIKGEEGKKEEGGKEEGDLVAGFKKNCGVGKMCEGVDIVEPRD
ncbi:MAG: hypothetical protein M1830_000389 [Pleopsidium flavum]|nr:MAG: hypothetical protein M1830_000389 [Pleopsidium flavum]